MQAELHAQLMRIEWAEQKRRIVKMLVAILFGCISLLCVMMFAGVLVLVSSWDTQYRMMALLAVIAFYGVIAATAWFYIRTLWVQSSEAFLSCREELAEDIALLKSKL